MSLAFVLDEHLRGPLWQAILSHNLQSSNILDAVHVGDPPDLPLGVGDAEVLTWAEEQNRILVTEDRHTMVRHLRDHLAAGKHSPGVIICRSNRRIRTLVDCLELVAYGGKPGDFADIVTYIP